MLLLLLTLATMVSAAMVAQRASAADATAGSTASSAHSQQATQTPGDDDRVEVQLVVLAVAVGLVVVFGSVAYLVRRKLGLVAPPPDPGEGGHDAH